ncbi:MAG: sulfatase-like hydrolase/transferase [Opitutaceae bacterium]|jgi:arylsulfatase A|nr:sulfatase-like hydrolase/transferase [Opitutaceae bacterium]
MPHNIPTLNRLKHARALLYASLITLTGLLTAAASDSRPNVLIMLADDMGYGDLGSYGGRAITPNIDRLAAEGVKFEDCYSGAPNCSPARVSLMTGRMPTRAGMYSYRPPGSTMHLRGEETTMAEVMLASGYQTAHVGKWHLSCLPQDPALNQAQPIDQGFQYSLGTENNAEPSHLNPVNYVRNGVEIGEQKGYSGQLLADEVEAWFETVYDDEKPFLLYVPFHEPHAKIATPPELSAQYPDLDKKSADYFGNIQHMDSAVGRILAELKARGVADNTLIFFGSDNGSYRMGSNGNLRGLKGGVYEGGIKVPGIFHFPKKFVGGRVSQTPMWFPDLLPTVAAFTGAEIPADLELDGIDLKPLLTKGTVPDRDAPLMWYFYRSSPEAAMRYGDYNLIARSSDNQRRTHPIVAEDMPFVKSVRPEFFELYNLTTDPGQRHDLAVAMPVKLREMKAKFWPLFEASRAEGPDWEGLPPATTYRATHDKPAEFLRNQERFLP